MNFPAMKRARIYKKPGVYLTRPLLGAPWIYAAVAALAIAPSELLAPVLDIDFPVCLERRAIPAWPQMHNSAGKLSHFLRPISEKEAACRDGRARKRTQNTLPRCERHVVRCRALGYQMTPSASAVVNSNPSRLGARHIGHRFEVARVTARPREPRPPPAKWLLRGSGFLGLSEASCRHFIDERRIVIAAAGFVHAPRHGPHTKAILGAWP